LERLIEQNKERYYETLEQSSQSWHESAHDPWPYVNFLLFILKTAYGELVDRVGDIKAPRGSKTEMILAAIERLPREFTVVQLEKACPGGGKLGSGLTIYIISQGLYPVEDFFRLIVANQLEPRSV
jgi:hypothetical protein